MNIEELEKIPREYLTPTEVCSAMGMGKNSFYSHIGQLPFPVARVGKRYYIPKGAFIEYIRHGRNANENGNKW